MQTLLDQDAGIPQASGGKRALFYTIGGGLTILIATVAIVLGRLAYDTRRITMHESRLTKMVTAKPLLEQVTVGLEQNDGSPLIAAPANEVEVRAVLGRFGGQRQDEILGKAKRWAKTRVFLANDMVYFIFFDEQDVMRDFSLVSSE
jgi:hypothetical protein